MASWCDCSLTHLFTLLH